MSEFNQSSTNSPEGVGGEVSVPDNGWESIMEGSDTEQVDSLGEFSFNNFGAFLEDEESDLTPPMVRDAEGNMVPIRGRSFAGERVIQLPVKRSNGDIDAGWMALGMTERSMVDGETGLTVNIPYMIMGNVAEDSRGNSRTVARLVRADEQVALMKSLRREGITPNTGPVSMGTAEKAVRPASPNTPEAVKVLSIEDKVNDLSDGDRQLLDSFAFNAANKRSAQLGGYGSESTFRSQEMGRLMREMSEDAKSIAREYAEHRYGRDEVAF